MMIPQESGIHCLEDFIGYMHCEPVPEPMTKEIYQLSHTVAKPLSSRKDSCFDD